MMKALGSLLWLLDRGVLRWQSQPHSVGGRDIHRRPTLAARHRRNAAGSIVTRRARRGLLAAAVAILFPFGSALAAPFAYIVIGAPINALRVLDTQTNLDARSAIALPSAPRGPVALAPNGRLLYVLDTSGRILVVDIASATVTTMASQPSGATNIALSPDARRLYAVGPTDRSVIDLATDTMTTVPMSGILPLTDPQVAVGLDGEVYWTECVATLICQLMAGDPVSFAERWPRVLGGDRSTGLAVSPDGRFIYASADGSTHAPWAIINVVSTATHDIVARVDLGLYGLLFGRIAMSRDGTRLYSLHGTEVAVVDLTTLTIAGNVPLDVPPFKDAGIAVTPDGLQVYVTERDLGTVSVIDTMVGRAATVPGFGRADSTGAFVGPVATVPAVEYYNASLDHYFLTAYPEEAAALDAGAVTGWVRTGKTFAVFPAKTAGASAVCRFYIPPAFGDSHFFSASANECSDVAAKFPALVLEEADAFRVDAPDPATGSCPPGDSPVYRLWNARVDSNHRYMTDRALRDAMIAKGYVPEGYGPDGVAMCSP